MNLTTVQAADVLGITPKQLDNLMVRVGNGIAGRGHQGKSRKLSLDTVEVLAVMLLISRDTAASQQRALEIARAIVSSPDGSMALGALGSLHFDLKRLRSLLQQALADALEGRVTPKRGRPRKP